jgi:CheY-like chemotaxis protein/RNA polymerase subunit RPABC4/transcription elongation factor Spt4
LAGINQVQVNIKAGLTFAQTLRSILRQDPDVILVGEIRDLETAEIAFQAAVTGHLVLSTLHTNSSFAAITRLLDLGVDPFLMTSSLSLIVAQRLARRVCQECKELYAPAPELLQRFRLEESDLKFYHGIGCTACGKTGFSGRLGIYEMLRISGTLKELVRQKASESALRRASALAGTHTLLEDGLAKVRAGATNPEELVRVIELEAEENYACPNCAKMIHREFKNCPYCMFAVRNICESCGQDLKPEWKMCPFCSSRVTVHAETAESAVAEDAKPKELKASSDPELPATREMMALPAVKRAKILVVDDDRGIIKVIRKALEKLPMDVEIFTAGDGVEALEKVAEDGADLVILDVNMPRLDGFGVCDRLRKDIKTAFLPILMLTADAEQDTRTKGYLVGTDDYMNKPFAVPDFVARVTRLLRRTYGL